MTYRLYTFREILHPETGSPITEPCWFDQQGVYEEIERLQAFGVDEVELTDDLGKVISMKV